MRTSEFEREEDQLHEDLRAGLITEAEFRKQLRELQQDYRFAAQEAAQDAYDNEMERW